MYALPLDVERTGQRHPHCHLTSSVPRRYAPGPSGSATRTGPHAQGRVAVPPTLPLDVERTKTVRSRPSGSAAHTGPHAQGRVAVRLTLPLDVERTEAVRPGPSGSANGTLGPGWQCERYARARVAAPPTLPLDVERTKTVRSGPSGSAGSGDPRASRRCANARTCLKRAAA